ncbi:MAG: ABC transporter substrate-binding protein [Hyphomicrobiales bacterium]|nr:ABC transporter substrate-binding protein [Hyphomicrobiales bacterium]
MTGPVRESLKPIAMAAVAAAIVVSAAPAEARDEVRVPTLTAPFGAGITEQAVIFERLIAKRHPWVRLVAQESPGFVYNVKEMANNKKRYKTTTFWSSTGALWAADTAQKGFFPKRIPVDNFRWIVTRSSNCIWFTTFDPDIKSIKDFSGKRVGLGRRSQTHWALFTTKAIEVGMGVTDARLQYLGNHAGTDALLDGKVDVAVGLATITKDQKVVFPSGPVRKLAATGKTFFHIPIPNDATEKVNKDLNAPFVAHRMAANTLPNQPETLDCIGDFAFMASHRDFPDEIAYELTKVYLEIDDAAGKYLGGGKLYRRASMCIVPKGIQAHPASLKACKDFGIEPQILN